MLLAPYWIVAVGWVAVPQCTYRDIYEKVLAQLNVLHIGSTKIDGLLVMCNREDVLGALATYPAHLLQAPQGEGRPIQSGYYIVRVAGATCRHGLIFQTKKGFLSGDYIEADDANAGFTRATHSMTLLGPKDMTGLPGAFQVIAIHVRGLQTVEAGPDTFEP